MTVSVGAVGYTVDQQAQCLEEQGGIQGILSYRGMEAEADEEAYDPYGDHASQGKADGKFEQRVTGLQEESLPEDD